MLGEREERLEDFSDLEEEARLETPPSPPPPPTESIRRVRRPSSPPPVGRRWTPQSGPLLRRLPQSGTLRRWQPGPKIIRYNYCKQFSLLHIIFKKKQGIPISKGSGTNLLLQNDPPHCRLFQRDSFMRFSTSGFFFFNQLPQVILEVS